VDAVQRTECGLIYPDGVEYVDGTWDFGNDQHEVVVTGEETLKYILTQIEMFVFKIDESDGDNDDEVVIFDSSCLKSRATSTSQIQHLLSMRI